MTVNMQSQPINAFHFIPADPIDIEEYGSETLVQRVRIERELPNLRPVLIEAKIDDKGRRFLTVRIRHETGNLFALRVEEEGWLVEDPSESLTGYKAYTNRSFPAYMASRNSR